MITEPDQPVVALLGSLDTKGAEYAYLRELVRDAGGRSIMIDTGVLGEPTTPADHDRAAVAAAAGADLDQLRQLGDRDSATAAMAAGARVLLAGLVGGGEIDAVLAIGGSNAGYVMAEACAGLPVGFPKVLVSTIASGNTRDYVRHADLTLINPIVDINGLNRINRPILANAVRSAVAMAAAWRAGSGSDRIDGDDRPLAAVTMFGVTTDCGSATAAGLGAGRPGGAQLPLHRRRRGDDGVPDRLRDDHGRGRPDHHRAGRRAGRRRLHRRPGPADRGRPARPAPGDQRRRAGHGQLLGPAGAGGVRATGTLIRHNPTVTLMRTTVAECRELGRRLATKINAATGPVSVIFPTRGLSQLSVPGGPFEDRAADEALLTELRAGLRPELILDVLETDINDPAVAARAVELLTGWMAKKENA